MLRVLSVAVVVAWALVAHQRVLVWHSDVTLWTDAVAKAPQKARGIINLARAIQDRNPDDPRIIPLYQNGEFMALAEHGISVRQQRDWYALGLANEGRYHRLHNRLGLAEQFERRALEEVPQLLFARAEWVLIRMMRSCRQDGTRWICPPLADRPMS